MIKIPSNNQWSQNNDSDIYGVMNTSFNLDLSAIQGKLRVAPRTVITTNDIANLGVPIGFVRFNNSTNGNGFYTIAGDRVFNSDSVDAADNFIAASGSSTAFSADTADLIFFKKANKIVGSVETSLSSAASTGGWSTVAGTPLTGGTVHMLCEYGNRLYVTNNYKSIISFDTSMNTDTPTFSLGTLDTNQIGLRLVDIMSASDRIWMLTATSQHGEPAKILTWDGATVDDPIAEYLLDTSAVVAGVLVNDELYIINSEAELMVFNGGGFVRIPNGRLPVNKNKYLDNTFSSVNDRWIHPNGIVVDTEGRINILINNVYEDGTTEERLPSGIWEFDTRNPELGWRHKLALSLYVASVTDYGQNQVSRVGGLFYAKTPSGTGTFLAGAQLYTSATATGEFILTNNTTDAIQKYGYFITQKIYSSSVQDAWNKIYARVKKLPSSTDKIVVKYRTDEIDPILYTGTWASTTSFTVTGDLRAYVGYEVEVLRGVGGGKCSHITEVVFAAGTSTVTVDETYTGATGTFKMRLQKWTKAGSFTAQDVTLADFGVDQISTWIQFKVCLQLTGVGELDDLILLNTKHL